MLLFVAGDQPAVPRDHPPPRESVAGREDSAHGPGGPRVASLLRHLTVGGDLSGSKPRHDRPDPRLEIVHAPQRSMLARHPTRTTSHWPNYRDRWRIRTSPVAPGFPPSGE